MRTPKHPGKLLKDELNARDLSANKFALDLGVPANRISGILNGSRSVSSETALRLGEYFGNSPEFWVNLQSNHDLGVARAKHSAEIKRTVRVPAVA